MPREINLTDCQNSVSKPVFQETEDDFRRRITQAGQQIRYFREAVARVKQSWNSGDRFVLDAPSHQYEFAGRTGEFVKTQKRGEHYYVVVKWDSYKGKKFVQVDQFERFARKQAV